MTNFLLAAGLFDAGVFQTLGRPDLWQATLAAATPLTLAAVGGCISERSGVVNIGLEGMMLLSAFFSAYTVYEVTSHLGISGPFAAAIGVGGGALSGGIAAWLLAFLSVRLRANQIISGMAMNILALGLTNYLLTRVFGEFGTPAGLAGIPAVAVPLLSKIRVFSLGSILFQQNILTYVALALVVVAQIFLFNTTWGLRLRSVGESPIAADTAGIHVKRIRYLAVVTSGVLCGLAGAWLALNGPNGSFIQNMTSGRGFIALAALIVGRWTPIGAMLACLIFAFGQSLDINLSVGTGVTFGSFQVSASLLDMLPYLLTIVAVAGFLGRSSAPAADGVPYDSAE